MAPEGRDAVRWGVLIAIVSALFGFGGTVGAMAIRTGIMVETVNEHNLVIKAHTDEVKAMSDRLARDEARIDVEEALAKEVREALRRIEERLNEKKEK